MSRPWMPLYISDYLRDTRKLTAAEHGAYLLLIMEYWTAGGLPDDDRQLARIASMTPSEWRRAKPTVQAFFRDGWHHQRIEDEIAKAIEKHERRSEAGKRGGIAKANAKRKPGNATSNALASSSQPQPQPQKEYSEPIGSDAPASPEPAVDHRKRLFSEGLPKLAAMTGKGPDACRAFVGKCLKAAGDDAIIVLGLIEDAERNQVADPSGWIAARLKTRENSANGRRTVHDAIRDLNEDLLARAAAFDEPPPRSLCGAEGQDAVRLLPPGRRE